MKKSIAIVSLCLGAALSLAGCAKHEADSSITTNTEVTTDETGLESNAIDANDTLGNGDDTATTNSSGPANAQ